LWVGGDDHADDVQHVVGLDEFRVAPERVGRRGYQRLGRLVEGKAVEVAEVLAFGDAQNHRVNELVKVPQHRLRRDFMEIPRADGALQRFEDRILADALLAAESQYVVDLLARPLHAMGLPALDVTCFIGPQSVQMVAPEPDLATCRGYDLGRLVEVEDASAGLGEKAALGH
jgi:hypothetical protein